MSQELAKLKLENKALVEANGQLKQVAEELRATEEGLWTSWIQLEQAGEFEKARAALDVFGKRFPTSSKLPALSLAVTRLENAMCDQRLSALATGLSSQRRPEVEAAAKELEQAQTQCRTKEGKIKFETATARLATTLSKWPTSITTTEYKVRHVELRGRRFFISGTLMPSDYFNYRRRLESGPSYLRAFDLTVGDKIFRDLTVYCSRSQPKCESLVTAALAAPDNKIQGNWVIENDSRFFSEGDAETGTLILGDE